MAGDTLQFLDYRKPKLESGDYTFEVTQTYGDPDGGFISNLTKSVKVKVQGDRIRINPDQIFAKYPPEGEQGNFTDTIPHIALKKPTLPWERSAYTFDNDLLYNRGADNGEIHESWLYLMLINEEDLHRGDVLNPESVRVDGLTNGAYVPEELAAGLLSDIEFGAIGAEEEVQVVDLKKSFFKALIADRKEDLQYLAHVRRRYGIQEIQKDATYSPGSLVSYQGTYYRARKAISSATLSSLPTEDWQRIDALQANQAYDQDTVVLHNDNLYKAKQPITSATITESLSETDWEAIKVDDLQRELSVIMGNRFAQSDAEKYPMGMVNHALLVSLEGYLNHDDSLTDPNEATTYISEADQTGRDLEDLAEDSYVRCIVLSQWSFTSKRDQINFEERSKALDVDALRLPSVNSSPEHLFVKDLPQRDTGTTFDNALTAGFSGILHQFRLGDRSLSWYRGPCVPSDTSHSEVDLLSRYEKGIEADGITYSSSDADRFLYYDSIHGMFTISYAAAYELGRFLAMKNEEYAKVLYRYKKAKSRYVFLNEEDQDRSQDVIDKGITIENLPYSKLNEADLIEDESFIRDYLEELALLKEIPHWYLIPDPNLLPQRTIRTFQIDFKWTQSLWLGALSLGGRARVSTQLYEDLVGELTPSIPQAGFFLRSDLVWAYPEMEVVAKFISPNNGQNLDLDELKSSQENNYTDFINAQPSLTVLRQEELTPEILMVLTDQDLNYLSLALPPEALHYGSDTTHTPVESLEESTNVRADSFTSNKLYVAGKRFSVVWAQGATIADSVHQISYSLENGTAPSVEIQDTQLTINLGMVQNATKVGELKSALLAHPSIESVALDSEEQEFLLDDSYQEISLDFVISGKSFTLIQALGHTLSTSDPLVTYDLAKGVAPTVALDGSGQLTIHLGDTSACTSVQALKIALQARVEIQEVRTAAADTDKLLVTLDAYTQDSHELYVAGKKYTLTMEAEHESAITDHTPTVTFNVSDESSTPIPSLSGGVLTIELGTKDNPTSVNQLKTALEGMDQIASVAITDQANTPLRPEGFLKARRDLIISGRIFTLKLAENSSNPLIGNALSVVYDLEDGTSPTVDIIDGRLEIHLGGKDVPTKVGQLKTALEGMTAIASLTTNAVEEESLILNAYTQNKLLIANKELALTYHTDLLDDHIPLVRDILALGSQPKARIQERQLVIDVGGKQSPTTLAELKTALEAVEGIDEVATLPETANTDPIHPYKPFTYQKTVMYNGSAVGDALDISDLVNNQGIVAVSELADAIKQHLTETKTYTDFASAHLSRFMLEGEPKVEFSAGGTD
jgi:hypothetical protein